MISCVVPHIEIGYFLAVSVNIYW